MKRILIFCFLAATMSLSAQTMKWVPLAQGTAAGKCTCASTTKNNYLCYTLEYTPQVSGTLTSYTTGFFVSCTSIGPCIAKNESCTMTNNVKMVNGCDQTGKILINSSGNSGTITNARIEAGKPVYLHQVCFTIPAGESINIEEDELTDLTTSVDLGGGNVVTEYPSFQIQSITRPRYDESRPTEWLDFKTISAGEHIAQLDWSVRSEKTISHFGIERSMDGVVFTPIGDLKAEPALGGIRSYQFLDPNAVIGTNYYRLQLVEAQGGIEYSPVRTVNFGEKPFGVNVSPNPATEYILVNVAGQKEAYVVRMIDLTGHIVKEIRADRLTAQTKIMVEDLHAGVYTVQVKSGENDYAEKVVIDQR